MPDRHPSRRSTIDRPLPVRARGDLQSVAVAFGGQESFVVKDPVAGESFHLSAVEHRLLAALRNPTSLRDLQRIVETEFAPRQAKVGHLQQFIHQLFDQGLLLSENPGQGAELLQRGAARRRRTRLASLLQVLAIRVGGFDAGPLVDRLYAAVRWIFSPWAAAAAALLVGYAALLIIGNAHAIAARLPAIQELVAPRRLPLWLAAIAGVKVLHELGHALACRRQGARPQEMGLLLLAGAPALYCDVSDAWRLPSKWRRMAVSSAGMAVELVVAAVAAIVWWHAAPGPLSAVCLSLVVVSSVGTLAVNANPLLRYDGYYLLADWLEVPNLAERSRGFLSSAWRQWILGERAPADPFVGPGKRRALWIYAILAKLYVGLVLAGVLTLLVRWARPHGLQNAVYTLAALTVAGMLLRPAAAAARSLGNPSFRGRLRGRRLAATLALVGGLAAIAWWWPMARRVAAPLVAVPAQAHPVFATTAGELQFAAADGAWVDAGDVIARLANPDLELKGVALAAAVRERRLHLRHLQTLQASLPAAARMLPAARAELADAEAQLAEHRAMADALVIRAPAAGRVLAPPARPAPRGAEGTLAAWSGSPLAPRNLGAWMEPGTPIAVVAAPGGWIAWSAVDEADAPAVEVGQPVRVMVDQLPAAVLAGRVLHVSRRARDNRPADDASSRDAAVLGDQRYHVVEIALDDDDAALVAGARGTAKITTNDATLGQLAWLRLRRMFDRTF